MEWDWKSLVAGALLSGVAFFFTGFLRRAGEDAYRWFVKRYRPSWAGDKAETPQVIVQFQPPPLASTAAAPQILTPIPVEQISNVTYEEIHTEVSRAPPLQQQAVAARYIGQRVDWEVFFWGGSKRADGMIKADFTVKRGAILPRVSCEVRAEDYPQLEILHEGARARITGEITEAKLGVTLTDARLQFFKE